MNISLFGKVVTGVAATIIFFFLTAVHSQAAGLSQTPAMNMDETKNWANDVINHKIDFMNQTLDWINNRSGVDTDSKVFIDHRIYTGIHYLNNLKSSINSDTTPSALQHDIRILESGEKINITIHKEIVIEENIQLTISV